MAEAAWEGRIDLPCHHRVCSTVMGFDRIPEGLSANLGEARRQKQGKRRHMGLARVIGHEPGPLIHHPRR
jgi:hypothetical protein